MSIFKSILAKIFPSGHPANQSGSGAPPVAAGSGTGASTGATMSAGHGSGSDAEQGGSMGTAAASQGAGVGAGGTGSAPRPLSGTEADMPGGAAPMPTAQAQPSVDVEAILSDLQSKSHERLNWRTSIVDLMKLLGLDSSLGARKELAKELNYTGSMEDSAAMNMWLHKQVMRKLAENGGKLPEELRS
ncbi:DUF3597 domain-containing protein [Parapusillimonas sp. SGNA-6]|nr:DUF3597 domain-containing protein [Parapusillimonas sp. SGNA-6]